MTPPPIVAARAHCIAYRPETDDDMAFLRALYASVRADEMAMTGWPTDVQRGFLDSQFDLQRHHYRTYFEAEWLIVERQGVAIGRLYLARATDLHNVIDIALTPVARGQGVGGAIMADILAEAASLSRGVALHVEAGNPARRLYGRLGFLAASEDPGGLYDRLIWTPAPSGAIS